MAYCDIRCSNSSPDDDFEDFLDDFPEDALIVSLLRAYMDESNTHTGAPVMAIAGYVWRKAQVSRFNRQWRETLDEANKGKDCPARYFHMKDAGGDPPKGEFRSYTADEVDALARKLIAQARQRTLIGFGVTFSRSDYDELLAGRGGMPSAYAFGCYAILGCIRRWADTNKIDQRIAYFFEAGHPDEGNARQFVGQMLASQKIRRELRHFSDQWISKIDAPPLQASDMLAWHSAKFQRNLDSGKALRKDFMNLVRPDLDLRRHYERSDLENLLKAIERRQVPSDAGDAMLRFGETLSRRRPSPTKQETSDG